MSRWVRWAGGAAALIAAFCLGVAVGSSPAPTSEAALPLPPEPTEAERVADLWSKDYFRQVEESLPPPEFHEERADCLVDLMIATNEEISYAAVVQNFDRADEEYGGPCEALRYYSEHGRW